MKDEKQQNKIKWECWQETTKWQQSIIGLLKKHSENTRGA
jgi:hypothetical protein